MIDSVKSFILNNKMIDRGDTIWVALSGGADSSCLLDILLKLKDGMEYTLKAVHVNHMLRGNESDSDEEFCSKACAKAGVDLLVFYANVRQIASDRGMTIEQAGRAARYEIFKKQCDGKIALAHNLNDNAETVLMNLMRGTGTSGLSGIKAVNGKFIRPLLGTGRPDIEKYCLQNEIKYVTDSSNEDTVYFRNAVRHKLIPLMDELTGKDIVPVIARGAKMVMTDRECLLELAEEAAAGLINIEGERVSVDNSGLLDLHPALSARVIKLAVEMVKGNVKDIEACHIALIQDAVSENRTGGAVDLPDGVKVLVQFGKTIISRNKDKQDFEYILPVPGKIFIKEKNLTITTEYCEEAGINDPGGDVHYFRPDTFRGSLMVRNRRNGDIIRPWKGRGTVKLKKYFIDKKIERYRRDEMLLIAGEKSLAYIEGMDYGEEYAARQGASSVKVVIERSN